MARGAKTLFIGFAVAVIIAAVGFSYDHYEQKKGLAAHMRAMALCSKEVRIDERYDILMPGECDRSALKPWERYALEDDLEIYRKSKSSDVLSAAVVLSFAILFVSSIPLLWYFVLARVSEVAAAIRGTKP